MANVTVDTYKNGVLIRTSTVEVAESQPAPEDRIALLESKVDLLVTESVTSGKITQAQVDQISVVE